MKEPFDPRLGRGGTPAAINPSYTPEEKRRIANSPPAPPSNANDGDCNDPVCEVGRGALDFLIGDPLHNPEDAVGLLPAGKVLKLPKLFKGATGAGKGSRETRQASRARRPEEESGHARDATPEEVNVPKGRGTDPAIGRSTPRPLPDRPITRSDLERKPGDIRDRTTASRPERGEFERRERELSDRERNATRNSKQTDRKRFGVDLLRNLLGPALPAGAAGGAAAGASAGGDDDRDRTKDLAAPRGGSEGDPDSERRRSPGDAPSARDGGILGLGQVPAPFPPAHAPRPPDTSAARSSAGRSSLRHQRQARPRRDAASPAARTDASDGYRGLGRKPPPESEPYDPRFGRGGTPAAINVSDYSEEDRQRIIAIEESKQPPDTTPGGNVGDFFSGLVHGGTVGLVDLGGDKSSDAYGAGDIVSYAPISPASVGKSIGKGGLKLFEREAAEETVETQVKRNLDEGAERAADDVAPRRGIDAPGPVKPRERPSWKDSEDYVGRELGPEYRNNKVSYRDGKVVPYGTKGSSRPDFTTGPVRSGHRTETFEVKNYDIESARGRSNLARNISKQSEKGGRNLPRGSHQQWVIDARGQKLDRAAADRLAEQIVRRSKGRVTLEDIDILMP